MSLAGRNGSGHCGDATMPRDSPEGRNTLTGNGASPFQAEPTHLVPHTVYAHPRQFRRTCLNRPKGRPRDTAAKAARRWATRAG